MYKSIASLLACLLLSSTVLPQEESQIRINLMGYPPEAVKVAVFGSMGCAVPYHFTLHRANTGEEVFRCEKLYSRGSYGPFASSCRMDFTEFKVPGRYYILAGDTRSPEFRISLGVYDHSADYLLKYMRQQRCGFNPFLADSCHLDDGFIVYHPTKTGERINAFGGWHDATDYLQYTATSANAVYQLLLSYRENPGAFGDAFRANGMPGPNGIPDVIDEAKFGMDWLKRMNPSPTEYFNQIADDRDHAGFRLPNEDSVVYDPNHRGRPVYLASAEKQGMQRFQNHSTGVASTAGKYASAFALGAMVLKDFYPAEYTGELPERARAAYAFGKRNPGVSQTAPCKGPYFYEEENWVDDMELAAGTLYRLTGEDEFRQDALYYASQEQVSPWMGRDTARHYQYYPFMNAGHFELAGMLEGGDRAEVAAYYRAGLELLSERGKDNPFFMGVPFIWCSNNLVAAALSQCKMYRLMTGDSTYLEMEAALRDWLFGCNPWGTSMIVGLPAEGDFPSDPHSSLTILEGFPTNGGLVDGPVYGSIFNSLIGLELHEADEYAAFQSPLVVYHDDAGDYSTNEPTMDGTACLVYYLSSMEEEASSTGHLKKKYTYDSSGAIRRGDQKEKKINLVFTGDEHADGAQSILQTLIKQDIKASFFLTGRFYANPENQDMISGSQKAGHYLGAHSDKHLLYNDWTKEKNRLVSREEFREDIEANYQKMEKYGIRKEDAAWFLPPFEWNDQYISQWTHQMGLTLVNHTPGTLSHADYTTPDMDSYRSSDAIMESILDYEQQEGLNGFMLLFHIGTHPRRSDKFHNRLEDLIEELKQRGYDFVPLEELLDLSN